MLDKAPKESQVKTIDNFAELGEFFNQTPTDSVTEEAVILDDGASKERVETSAAAEPPEQSDVQIEKDNYLRNQRPQLHTMLVGRGYSSEEADTILQKSLDIEFNQATIHHEAVERIEHNVRHAPLKKQDAVKEVTKTKISSDDAVHKIEITDSAPHHESSTVENSDTQASKRATQIYFEDARPKMLAVLQERGISEAKADTMLKKSLDIEFSKTAIDYDAVDRIVHNLQQGTLTEIASGERDQVPAMSQNLENAEVIPDADEVGSDSGAVIENEQEGFDFGVFEQWYKKIMINPLSSLTDEDRMTLHAAYENYERIAVDSLKTEDVKEQAAHNVERLLEDMLPEPTSVAQVAEKMAHIEKFLNEYSSTKLSHDDQETIKAMQHMYESVAKKAGETDAAFVERLVQQCNNLESFVMNLYHDGKLMKANATKFPTSNMSNDTAAMEVTDASPEMKEALEGDFTQAVQHHIHNLRLLLEAEGRGPRFSSVTSNGPLKQSDITRWLEVSEKKYNALRAKLSEAGTVDLVRWADEQIAPLEIKLGWRKKPSLFKGLAKRWFGK